MAKEKQTNADRIRAMSDKELSKIIDPAEICVHRSFAECIEKYGNECESCILDWLKHGVE